MTSQSFRDRFCAFHETVLFLPTAIAFEKRSGYGTVKTAP